MEFKTYNKEIDVNGHRISVCITINVEEDDLQIEDTYDDQVEAFEDIRKRFERDGLFLGCIIVTAESHGLSGIDSLGACELNCNNFYNSTPFENSVQNVVKHYGMIENALNSLKNALESEYERLTEQAKAYKKFRTL